MLVLQSCTDSLHILPGLCGKSYATPSDGSCNSSNIEVEEDVDVTEVVSTTINKAADIGIKQEGILEVIPFSGIKCEPGKVSLMCVCVCLLADTCNQCPEISVFFCDVSISVQLKQLICWG